MQDSKLNVLLVDNDDPMGPNLREQMVVYGARVEQAEPGASANEILERALALGAPGSLVLSSSTFFAAQRSLGELIRISAGNIPLIAVGAACDLLAAAFKGRVLRKKGNLGSARVEVRHDRRGIFSDVSSPFIAAVHTPTILTTSPPGMVAHATSVRGVMLIEHETYPMLGIRFRPDSVVSRKGPTVLAALLDWAASNDPRLTD